MALLDTIVGTVGNVVGAAGDAYLLIRQKEAENKATQDRAAAEKAQAEASLMAAKSNSELIAKVGKYATFAAVGMLGLTLLAQLRRMWRGK